MKEICGLIKKDILNLSSYKISLLVMFVCVFAIGSAGEEMWRYIPIVMTTMLGMIALSTFSYDELAKSNEYVLSLPVNKKKIVVEKYILKQAFKNDIPTDIIERKKSPFPKTYSKKYLEILENKLIEILDNKNSKILEIINENYVRNLIKTHGSEITENLFGQLMTYPQTLAFLIQIDYWLTAYNIKIII